MLNSANSLWLTNSLLVSVTNWSYAFSGSFNATNTSAANVFQTVGGGAFYLVEGSTNRNAGTTNINADLRNQLARLTTYPPLVVTGAVTMDTAWGPTVLRDSDLPDRGYHYPSLDYAINGVALSATLTLTNGAAVAVYGNYGWILGTNGQFVSQGTPEALNRLTRSQTVQEQPWPGEGNPSAAFNIPATVSPRPSVQMRFTDISFLAAPAESAGARQLFPWGLEKPLSTLTLVDCSLRGVSFRCYPGDTNNVTFGFTNSVFERCTFGLEKWYGAASTPFTVSLRNNLFWNGRLALYYTDSSPNPYWELRDNAFDAVTLIQDGASGYLLKSHNAYINATSLGGASNVVLTNFVYATGALGRWYQGSTNLGDAGSRNATSAGLARFTTRTNQAPEGTSTVDIGFHYVAANAGTRLPVDSDSDGLADYVEDRNGNGAMDAGETSVSSTDSDGDGLGDLQEYELQWNVLVNDPMQDYGNEQNTQFQPKVVALGNTVVVGFWDSNQGVYQLGAYPGVNTSPVRMVAYSISQDGGRTFTDKGVPPLPQGAEYGDAGDPVLAVDRSSEAIYFVGTSERNLNAFRGVPFWKSVDRGQTFADYSIIRPDLTRSDYAWITVDDWAGTGQHDVYIALYIPTPIHLLGLHQVRFFRERG